MPNALIISHSFDHLDRSLLNIDGVHLSDAGLNVLMVVSGRPWKISSYHPREIIYMKELYPLGNYTLVDYMRKNIEIITIHI